MEVVKKNFRTLAEEPVRVHGYETFVNTVYCCTNWKYVSLTVFSPGIYIGFKGRAL